MNDRKYFTTARGPRHRTQRRILLDQAPLFIGLANYCLCFVKGRRLGEVIISAMTHCFEARLKRGVRGKHDDFGRVL